MYKSSTWFWILSKLLGFLSLVISGCHTAITIWALVVSFTRKSNGPNDNSVQIDSDIYSKHFILTFRICLGISAAFSFGQLICGLNIFLSFTRRIRDRCRVWTFFSILTFLVLMICLLLPITINERTGESHEIANFGQNFKSKSIEAFNFKNVKTRANENGFNFNIHLFYMASAINGAFTFCLIFFMVIVLFCRFGFEGYEIVN